MAINFVEQLPEELALAVLQHLSFEDRARACCVNSTWAKLTREQVFGPPTLELRPKLVRSPFCSILHYCKRNAVVLRTCRVHPWHFEGCGGYLYCTMATVQLNMSAAAMKVPSHPLVPFVTG